MNYLTHKLPKSVLIDGISYLLNTNFRNCLLTIEAIEDKNLTDAEKKEIIIENMYQEPYPKNIQKAIELAFKFLQCGREQKNKDNEPILLDLKKDSKYIYDALLVKGINLDEFDNMHYWTLMSHIAEADKNTFLCRLIYLRLQKHKGKLSKEEKAECQKIGWDIIDIDTPFKEEEELENFLSGNLEKKEEELENFLSGN